MRSGCHYHQRRCFQGDFDLSEGHREDGELFSGSRLAGARIFGYVHSRMIKRRNNPSFLAGPTVGCLINFEMAAAFDIPMMGKMISNILWWKQCKGCCPQKFHDFTRWSRLEKGNGGYAVELNRIEKAGMLSFAKWQCALIIREVEVKEGTAYRFYCWLNKH